MSHIPSRSSTPSLPPPPPPKLKTITLGKSAALVVVNERIVELKKELAGTITKATKANVGKSHPSPGPKPGENFESTSSTLVSKGAVDPEATDNPPPLGTIPPRTAVIQTRQSSLG